MLKLAAQRGYSILALLFVAQLSIAVHAAEHGTGQHSHDNVVCEIGAVNDDDLVVAPLFSSPLSDWRDTSTRPTAAVHHFSKHAHLTPPATGPPQA